MTRTNNVNAKSSPSSSEQEAVCYLCLDAEPDEDDGELLRRDCSCRGTEAGFVHLTCLADYAAAKSKQTISMNLGMKEFVKPWQVCPNCRQVYQKELRIDIAAEFVSFVRRQYPDDTQKQVEALYLKLRALNLMIGKTTVSRNREAGVTANVLLSLIDRMKHDVSPLSMRYYEFKANVYATLGNIALAEGTEESARRAVAHFDNQLKVNEVTGDVDGIACSKSNIEMAKTRFEGGRKYEESLKRYQELYALRVSEKGERNEYTIIAGINYAILLQRSKGAEASELLMKLLATSKQVFGSHHNITKTVESTIKQIAEVYN